MKLGNTLPRLFNPLLAGASLRDRLIACIGALIGIALTAFACTGLHLSMAELPFLLAPIGASAVLVFAVPASPLAQPWSVVGGNIVSAIAGVTMAHLMLPPMLAAGLAVSGAILAMSLLRCLHPPGGAVALTAVIGGPVIAGSGYLFALMPVATNSLALVLVGLLFHRFSGHSYPHRPAMAQDKHAGFHPEAIDQALADLGETFDVSREDLDLLLQRAAFHERERRSAARRGAAGRR
ncbi:HPP family protein [Sphingomonas sp. QA11]|uniref:HPP family protein n=1 Tax=Sphingomonas sp. QA11 TaxID=2950605 RepID=UPI002349CB22|nr:HPP family protein [Sphingomonas sp. QA11]WCM26949.1 HPP family protein [Sphingomonas sp. QA11]